MYKCLDFYKMMDSLGDGVICVNEQNKIEFMNQKAISIIGKNCEIYNDLAIDNYFNICTMNSEISIIDIIKEVRKSGITRGLEKDSFVYNHGVKKIFIAASLSVLEMNKVKYVLINFREITKLKQLELENIEQKNNLETIFNTLPVGVIIVNKERKVIQINPFMINNFKVGELKHNKQLLGNLLRCINAKENICGLGKACKSCVVRNSIDKIANHNSEYISLKLEFKHSIRNFEINRHYEVEFVKLEKNKEEHIMIIVQDITKQAIYEKKIKAAREEAVKANKLKSQFLSNMSHEIRTPLNGIIGMIDISKRSIRDLEVIDYLEKAKTSSLNLLQIINSVLDISKIESGKFVIQNKEFNLRNLFDELYEESCKKINNDKVHLNFKQYDYKMKLFISDRVRLKQVLSNIMDNAIKFTNKGEVILEHYLEKVKDGYELTVIIKDTGIGMNKSYTENLYQNFSQEDASYTRQRGGTGLGLAISKRIIEKMGGSIECRSRTSQGTRFTIKVCLQSKEENKESIKNLFVEKHLDQNINNKKIMINPKNLHSSLLNKKESIQEIEELVLKLKLALKNDSVEQLEMYSEELSELIEKNLLNEVKYSALRLKMDIRKNKLDNINENLEIIKEKIRR